MPSPADDTIIRLSDVGVSFDGRPVFSNLNMIVLRGEFLAITGPNGGGKTTLLRVILKLLRPDCGRVEYMRDGRPTKHLPIGYLPQKSMIDVRFPISVADTVRSGLLRGLRSRFTPADEEEFRRIVELMGIRDILSRPIGDLSGGQLQRTLLGRALISRPEVVVLDEPLSYVDKLFEQQIYAIMEHLAHEATMILVSHEMTRISAMASRHIIVNHGVHECTADHHFFEQPCC